MEAAREVTRSPRDVFWRPLEQKYRRDPENRVSRRRDDGWVSPRIVGNNILAAAGIDVARTDRDDG